MRTDTRCCDWPRTAAVCIPQLDVPRIAARYQTCYVRYELFSLCVMNTGYLHAHARTYARILPHRNSCHQQECHSCQTDMFNNITNNVKFEIFMAITEDCCLLEGDTMYSGASLPKSVRNCCVHLQDRRQKMQTPGSSKALVTNCQTRRRLITEGNNT
jgi:hypothetical protein